MTPPADPERYKNHRFPSEIISHGVWLYYRFPLSYRDVQEILFERGITVTHEAIRQWCLKFGQDYANQLKHRRPRTGDRWYSLNLSLRHEVARLIVWHVIRTRMLIEGGRPFLSLGSGFPTSSSPHRTSTFQRIRRSNSGYFRIFAYLIALR